jgi:hypothetical protein
MNDTINKNDRAFLDDGTMTKGNDHRDLVLVHLDVLLRMGTALFVVLSPDGTLQTRCDELLQRMYPDQFRIVGPSSVPTKGEWGRLNRSIDSETGFTERPYQVLRKFMGLLSWPKILIINHIESLSADQVSLLSGCLTFQERDQPIDWPGSIILILKKNNYLSGDLRKFVRNVIGND